MPEPTQHGYSIHYEYRCRILIITLCTTYIKPKKKKQPSAARSTISSKIIFASCVSYFDRAHYLHTRTVPCTKYTIDYITAPVPKKV